MRHHRSAALGLAALLCVAACGDNGTTVPSQQSVAGTYVATQLLTTTGGITTNQLNAGSSVTLVLGADGSTSGRLFVPGTPQVDVSLIGTWDFLNATDIDLNSSADTFLRDMLLSVSGNSLVGDQTFGSTRIQIILTKQ